MRRLLSILLLALLPLHLSWAAVAPYCGHELAPQTQKHFGHHDHTATISAHAADDTGAATDITQLDCGQCHSHCTGVLAAPAVAQRVGIADILAAGQSARPSDQMPSPPERPQWARLA